MKRFLFIFILAIGFTWAILGATFERLVYGKNKNKFDYYS